MPIVQTLIRFAIRHLLAFLLVIAVLIAGKWLVGQWQEYRLLADNLAVLHREQGKVEDHVRRLKDDAAAGTAALRGATVAALDVRIDKLREQLREARAGAPTAPDLAWRALRSEAIGESVGDYFKRKAEIELLDQEYQYLLLLRKATAGQLDREAARQALQSLRDAQAEVALQLRETQQAKRQLIQAQPVRALFPGTDENARLQAFMKDEKALHARSEEARQALQKQQAMVDRLPDPGQRPAFSFNAERVAALLAPLDQAVRESAALQAQSWSRRALDRIAAEAPTAALVLLAAALTAIGIKFVLYFLVAPLAARRPPVRLDHKASGTLTASGKSLRPGSDKGKVSAVSQGVRVGRDDELLVRPEYLQASTIAGRKRTQWLLDWSCPFTSLAAGLVAITRVQADQAASFVISATSDPLSEIAVLSLPEGAAMAFHPRALVGVMYRKGAPPVIERQWRLRSLHAWLTLQLRYLVFRGPVTLIVKGCRGVRVETAGNGRSISQSATLGFSANVAYSTIRCETFFPYLIGRQGLFRDHFDGIGGFYVYEETPRGKKQPGPLALGLDGLGEAVGKVLGV